MRRKLALRDGNLLNYVGLTTGDYSDPFQKKAPRRKIGMQIKCRSIQSVCLVAPFYRFTGRSKDH